MLSTRHCLGPVAQRRPLAVPSLRNRTASRVVCFQEGASSAAGANTRIAFEIPLQVLCPSERRLFVIGNDSGDGSRAVSGSRRLAPAPSPTPTCCYPAPPPIDRLWRAGGRRGLLHGLGPRHTAEAGVERGQPLARRG